MSSSCLICVSIDGGDPGLSSLSSSSLMGVKSVLAAWLGNVPLLGAGSGKASLGTASGTVSL